ncbi:uncharacterized protein JCM6883_001908 [Sporobolomyces salmoneus]|uniref:uncharacterized protein n=1 Tax=Sporobolomyces salmoneus TaxID=183962 RepID=UPI003175DDA7
MATSSDLLSPFSNLTLESLGSPAPWETTPSSLPLHLRALVSAILSLSNALNESSDQLSTLRSLLSRSTSFHSELRQAVFGARDQVLQTSQQAQAAHAEAKRVDTLEGVFKKGADRAVASLDRRILRALRKGKMRAYKREGPEDDVCPVIKREVEEEFEAFNFVEELLIDLDVEFSDLSDEQSPASTLELDEEWLAMEEELVERLATKARERGSPSFRRTSLWRRQRAGSDASTNGESDGATTDGEDAMSDAGSDRISSPSTPPSSVHSTDDSEIDSLAEEAQDEARPAVPRTPPPDYDTLIELVTPLIHPVLLLLFRLRHILSLKLTSAIDAFESLVKASADAVKTHRDTVTRLNKNAAKIRDLKDLERRACEEEERLFGELRGVVVELARVRKLPFDSNGEYDDDERSDEEEEEEDVE